MSWRLVRLADIHAEHAPDPRRKDVGRLPLQFFCWWLLLNADDHNGEQD
jgi:hypothetical protein